MKEVARGVWQLAGFLPDVINVFLIEDVLIDTATRWGRSPLLRQLRSRPPRLIALTHAHPDHQGLAHVLCEHFRVPLACHEADVPVMEGRTPMVPRTLRCRLGDFLMSGPPHPVGQVLREGDEVAGFRVIHTPGHTPGHIAFFRPSDRLAIVGDLLRNFNFWTGRPRLEEPPAYFSVDAALNRRSIRKLAALEPEVVCFGHGPPLRRPELLQRFVATLPPDSCQVEFRGSGFQS